MWVGMVFCLYGPFERLATSGVPRFHPWSPPARQRMETKRYRIWMDASYCSTVDCTGVPNVGVKGDQLLLKSIVWIRLFPWCDWVAFHLQIKPSSKILSNFHSFPDVNKTECSVLKVHKVHGSTLRAFNVMILLWRTSSQGLTCWCLRADMAVAQIRGEEWSRLCLCETMTASKCRGGDTFHCSEIIDYSAKLTESSVGTVGNRWRENPTARVCGSCALDQWTSSLYFADANWLLASSHNNLLQVFCWNEMWLPVL